MGSALQTSRGTFFMTGLPRYTGQQLPATPPRCQRVDLCPGLQGPDHGGPVLLEKHLLFLSTPTWGSQDTAWLLKQGRPQRVAQTQCKLISFLRFSLKTSVSGGHGSRAWGRQAPGSSLLCCLQRGPLSSGSKVAAAAPAISSAFGQGRAKERKSRA